MAVEDQSCLGGETVDELFTGADRQAEPPQDGWSNSPICPRALPRWQVAGQSVGPVLVDRGAGGVDLQALGKSGGIRVDMGADSRRSPSAAMSAGAVSRSTSNSTVQAGRLSHLGVEVLACPATVIETRVANDT